MGFMLGSALLLLLGASTPVAAGSLKDIEHVVIFMQENRSWNSYFGTMAGVRGFNDPNVQINDDGKPVWYQKVNPILSKGAEHLLPWHLGYKDTEYWTDAIQCLIAGSNFYYGNQGAVNHGKNDLWAKTQTPWSWGYYKRQDLPVQYALAEGWTTGDMYQESYITSTSPNRVSLVSGSINIPGGPQTPDQGGPYIDNNEIPGCFPAHTNCYPLKWQTIYEIYEKAGVSWQLYQDMNDNFDDNPLAWFKQYQDASDDSPLTKKGMSTVTFDEFYAAAGNGTLPEISFLIGPAPLSEHPPYQPKDGAWLQKQVVDAVTKSPKYNSTLLMISYDESGGFGDHVSPFHSPEDTPGEWMEDPYGKYGKVFVGPGVRVPFYMISPWTRGNRVFTERADHNSQILFVEEWLEARGYEDVRTPEMVPWRREHMSNLVGALDLDHPDPTLPNLPEAEEPRTLGDLYTGMAHCAATHPLTRPPAPFGEQDNVTEALWFEDGYKEVVGGLTEGRYLTFEQQGKALTNPGHNASAVTRAPAHADHRDRKQRWVIHYTEDEESQIFRVSSALDGRWLGPRGTLVSKREKAADVRTKFLGNGKGYKLEYTDGSPLGKSGGYTIWSVTYH
ncbi:nonhemolytic phospholipases C family protein [Aspergillus candidus]|uniref:Phospholipase C n=1 Tax=Aspergillus candidus TaxID=41067 RepID=A0A2I2EXS3_ASPCN|nr:phospholipase C [Aspergillus candidus]PLB33161.1 phospholipase C [Aspergillus candidus]